MKRRFFTEDHTKWSTAYKIVKAKFRGSKLGTMLGERSGLGHNVGLEEEFIPGVTFYPQWPIYAWTTLDRALQMFPLFETSEIWETLVCLASRKEMGDVHKTIESRDKIILPVTTDKDFSQIGPSYSLKGAVLVNAITLTRRVAVVKRLQKSLMWERVTETNDAKRLIWED